MRFIAHKLQGFKERHGIFPECQSISDLETALMLRIPPQDAWGTSYRYVRSPDGQHYRLVSAGRNRHFEGNRSPEERLQSDDIIIIDGEFDRV
jgi:hypothetical protein